MVPKLLNVAFAVVHFPCHVIRAFDTGIRVIGLYYLKLRPEARFVSGLLLLDGLLSPPLRAASAAVVLGRPVFVCRFAGF